MAWEKAQPQTFEVEFYSAGVPTSPTGALTLTIDKDGAGFGAAAGTAVQIGTTPVARVSLTGADTNCDSGMCKIADAGLAVDDRYCPFTTESGWTATLATRLGYLFLGTGAVNTTIDPTCHLFSVANGSGVRGRTRILFTSGVCTGQMRTVVGATTYISPAYTKVLVMPGFANTPGDGDTFVVLPTAPTVADAMLCLCSAEEVSSTEYTLTLVTTGQLVALTDWLLGCQLIPAISCSYSPQSGFVGPARRITAVSGDGVTRTVTVDSAFTGGTPDYFYVIAGRLEAPTAAEVNALGPGTGENTVTITVDDGTDPLDGALVSIRATAGGASIRLLETDTLGVATVNLNDGTYYIQCGLRGYSHVEETVVISTNPQAVTLSMTGLSVEAPGDPDLVRLYLVQRTAEGVFAAGRPFTLRLNTPCLDSEGEIVPEVIESADDLVNGYAYADVYPTTALTRVDGGTDAITYGVVTTQGIEAQIEVEASPSVQDLSPLLHP